MSIITTTLKDYDKKIETHQEYNITDQKIENDQNSYLYLSENNLYIFKKNKLNKTYYSKITQNNLCEIKNPENLNDNILEILYNIAIEPHTKTKTLQTINTIEKIKQLKQDIQIKNIHNKIYNLYIKINSTNINKNYEKNIMHYLDIIKTEIDNIQTITTIKENIEKKINILNKNILCIINITQKKAQNFIKIKQKKLNKKITNNINKEKTKEQLQQIYINKLKNIQEQIKIIYFNILNKNQSKIKTTYYIINTYLDLKTINHKLLQNKEHEQKINLIYEQLKELTTINYNNQHTNKEDYIYISKIKKIVNTPLFNKKNSKISKNEIIQNYINNSELNAHYKTQI